MSKNSKSATTAKSQSSTKRLSLPTKNESQEELRAELNRCKAEVVCLRSKFNVEEIQKNRIVEWSTEKMFQESLINAEIDLKKYQDSSGNALRDHNSKLMLENSELKKNAKYNHEEITVLKHRCKSLEIECQKLQDECEQMRGQKADTKNYESALEEIKELRENIKQKEEQLVQLLADQQQRGMLQTKYDQLLKQLSGERAERKQIEDDLRERKKENQNLIAERKQMEDLRERKKENQNLVQKETIEQIRLETDAEIAELRRELESMRTACANLKADSDERKSLDGALADAKSQIQSLIAELEKQRESHLREVDQLKASLQLSGQERSTLQTELEKWKLDVQVLRTENGVLKSQLELKHSDQTDVSPELKELNDRLEKEKAAHARTKSQKEELENRCHDAFEKINQKEKLLKNMEEKHTALITRKDKTISELRRERTMVQPTSDNSRQEVQAMKEKLEYAMKEMKAIKDEYELLKKLRD